MARVEKLNVVVTDMEASVAFYRGAGLEIPDEAIWQRHHAEVREGGEGPCLALDSVELARHYAGRRPAGVLGLRLDTRDEVDATFERLTAAGAPAVREPHDAFWGSRYAIVEDPDGNLVGLMSEPDDERAHPPPDLG